MLQYKIRLIGDIHGNYPFYRKQIQQADKDGISTIQIGDFGLGFNPARDLEVTQNYGIDWSAHKFIRGNHDDPKVCNNHPGYLGDFGYIEEYDLFYISGAASIDKQYRTKDVNWWEKEELTSDQMDECSELYFEKKPRTVIAHDVPVTVTRDIFYLQDKGIERFPNRTSYFLDYLFNGHKPADYYFGHYHLDYQKQINGTRFTCVNEMTTMDIIL